MRRITSFSECPQLAEYADLVRTGQVAACAEQLQMLSYVEGVMAAEEIYIEQGRVDRYFGYEKYLYPLYPWERFCFVLHCCAYGADGLPRWPDLLLYMGRGAGKNGYMSFEDFCLITDTHGIRDYHIDICANSEEQAKTSFMDIYNALDNPKDPAFSKALRHNFKWNHQVIRNRKTGSEIRYRTNNAKSKDGMRSGKVDFDEIHQYENWDNLNVFTTGLGKKPHPRTTYATTDGDVRDAVLDSLKERAAAILNGEEPDNGLLPFICRLDAPDEVHDERNWSKANPSLPYKPDLMLEIRKQYANYRRDPIKNAGFMTKRMNVPQGKVDIEVTSWENIMRTNRPLPDLEGKACVCGIDYTKTTDFMSAVLLFRLEGERYYAIHHSWFCVNSPDRARIKMPLDEMERRGLLTMVDDVEVPPSLIAEWISAMRQRYNVVKVAADSFRWSLISRSLEAIGFDARNRDEVKMVRPSDIMFVQGTIDSLFTRGNIVWGDDPLMRWFTNNAKLEPAPNNNFKYGKIEAKSRKTDGFMAFVHAMTVADAIPEDIQLDFFEPLTF